MPAAEQKALQKSAMKIRRDLLISIYHAQSGHPGGSLSIAELLAVLYDHMHVDPAHPTDPSRDRLVLSKGHAAPALYAALAQMGFFDTGEITRLRSLGGILQGHPDMHFTPGVDISTGSLGLGLSAAGGMALAGKYTRAGYRVYCILGDGELQEGIVWEAAAMAAHYKLDNLTAFIDVNGLQIDGATADVLFGGHEAARFAAFGWNVLKANGHDVCSIQEAIARAESYPHRPTAVLLSTVKGKGVSFMENQAGWHGQAPNGSQFQQALFEIEEALRALEEAE